VRSPKDHGGLGVHDPELVNIVVGSKILWRLVTRESEWWKMALLKKYFSRDRRHFLDALPIRKLGSPIWNLLWASLPFFQKSLTWIPGNDRHINIWKDNVLGSPPLCLDPSFLPLRHWLSSQHKFSIFDISRWS
jgi:hypothetical protein